MRSAYRMICPWKYELKLYVLRVACFLLRANINWFLLSLCQLLVDIVYKLVNCNTEIFEIKPGIYKKNYWFIIHLFWILDIRIDLSFHQDYNSLEKVFV